MAAVGSNPPLALAKQPQAWGWRRPLSPRTTGYLLIAPALLLVLGVLGYPIVFDSWLSLTNAHDSQATGQFIGLDNYVRLLTSSSFWVTTRTTAFLTLTTAAVALVVGVLTALLLWWRFWGRSIVFLAVFVPWAFPAGFSAMAWYWMLMPPFHSFYTQHVLAGRFWLEGIFGLGAWQVFSIALMNIWRSSSIIAIFTLAGFNAIPEELLEYGKLETRNVWQYFWFVVAPLCRRFLVLAGLVAMVVSYTEYTSMHIETGGRIVVPVLGTLAYTETLVNGNTGLGAAVALVQVALAVLLTIVGLRLAERSREPGARSRAEAAELPPFRLEARPESGLCHSEESVPNRRMSHFVRHGKRRLLPAVLGSLAAVAVMTFHLFPVYYTAVQAVRPVNEIAIGNIFWAYHPNFDVLDDIVTDPVLARWTLNMFIVFGAVLIAGLAAALLAGYAMARLRIRGGPWLARAMFFSYFIPQTAIILPMYQVFNRLNLDNTLGGLILVYFSFAVPFATWLFYVYFQGFDADVEEHALLDGSRVVVFRRIVLPMAWPVIIAAGLFAIGMMGSDVFYAGTLALSNDVKTLPGGLGITAIDLNEWAQVNAAVLIASLPIMLLCAALSRYFVSGLRAALIEGA
ncbi:MAG TPA: ABC transporter permease subunit [Chloroflexota bacterium]|nr:ABC transporter permease subunit [Chloroflexota bacterium]